MFIHPSAHFLGSVNISMVGAMCYAEMMRLLINHRRLKGIANARSVAGPHGRFQHFVG